MSRAAPLPLDERRAALVAAAEPLLQQLGREVSTRQIAEAAGVAEGTLFRAFPTKDALIDAVIAEVFDVRPTCAALEAIDPVRPVEARLVTAVEILQNRLRRVFALFHTLRLDRPRQDPAGMRARQAEDNAKLNAALATVLRPDTARLRVDLGDAADVVRAVSFCLSHPLLGGALSRPQQVVDLLLHGIVQTDPAPAMPAHPTAAPGRPTC